MQIIIIIIIIINFKIALFFTMLKSAYREDKNKVKKEARYLT